MIHAFVSHKFESIITQKSKGGSRHEDKVECDIYCLDKESPYLPYTPPSQWLSTWASSLGVGYMHL